MNPVTDEKRTGALWGTFIGDALAMPGHWYYDRAALHRDYGVVRDYLAPRRVQADGLEWLRVQPAEAGTWVLANLFLHHFTAESLRALFNALAEKAELFCACEPHRDWWSLAASRMLGLIGANAVTRHDAAVSVRAGFQGGELSALWPADSSWRLREYRAGFFSHLILAQRT
jgi:hypothetical protein